MSASSGPRPLRPPTIDDVARHAGVHAATVSRALNRPAMVAGETRSRILAAVEELDFVPNRSAQRLAGGRVDAVGVVVPDIANPYFARILQSIQTAATSHGLAVLIADSAGDPCTEARILEALSRRVDGLVVCTPVTDLSQATVPVVQVNRQSRTVPSVVVDQTAIVSLAVDHLVGLGHRRIAYLQGPQRYWSAHRRSRVVARIGRERRTEVRLESVHPVDGTFEAGRDIAKTVVSTGATAVIAFNDLQAAGLLIGVHAAGLRVPDDLSIVGSDGLDLADMTEPGLTTVVAPRATIGTCALDRLLADRGPNRTVLQPSLAVAASTGRPRQTSNHLYHAEGIDIDVG